MGRLSAGFSQLGLCSEEEQAGKERKVSRDNSELNLLIFGDQRDLVHYAARIKVFTHSSSVPVDVCLVEAFQTKIAEEAAEEDVVVDLGVLMTKT